MTTISDETLKTSRTESDELECLDVLVIGAGFSGICTGIKLREQGVTNFRIVEKSNGIGGTWYDNTYPGATCDVPSHFYCFSFEPNPDWSRVYSPQPEIQRYLENCVDKYGLRAHIAHGTRVRQLRLNEREALWEVCFEGGNRVFARHVINGGGGLHKPSIPDINGRDSFAGATMHTARWDHSVDLAGKRVAVIGSAASAIQVIPEAAEVAASVTVFQRTPNYIVPRMDRAYSPRTKRILARWPWLQRFYRWVIFKRMDVLLFSIIRKDARLGRQAARRVNRYMRSKVNDRSLHGALTPDYALGCKRILLSDDLFDALNRDNVCIETAGIDAIEPAGIRTVKGDLHEFDIIVYATGFDLPGHARSIEVIGLDGTSLADAWSDGEAAYNGCCVAGFPNYWMITGPNTGVAATSVVFMIEQIVNYVLRLMAATGAGELIGVRKPVQEAYNAGLQSLLSGSVWASGCKSWYLSKTGRITTLYPKNAAAFRRQLAAVRMADFEIMGSARAEKAACTGAIGKRTM